MTETQERFLREIAARVPTDRVAELHLFPSLRQGQLESGVAIVAVEAAPPAVPAGDSVAHDGADCDPTEAASAGPAPDEPTDEPTGGPAAGVGAARLTIYSAHYRLTIKGPDRGKWELSVAAEADAPVEALEAVVRGVRHRAGDEAETARLSGDEFRAALAPGAAAAWPAPK